MIRQHLLLPVLRATRKPKYPKTNRLSPISPAKRSCTTRSHSRDLRFSPAFAHFQKRNEEETKIKNMASNQFDSQASTNYKEAFALFDKRGNGRCAVDSLGDLLRACGQNPTLAEIQELEKGLGGEFDFETFQRILNRPGGFRDPGEPEEYCRGFQVFDKDMTGFIGVGQLKYILTNLGEKMTEEEVDELLKAVDTSSGQINYTDLVRTILAN
ncbi:hypothetical protein TsFJ059_007306 [Trichoderma semiorbis]|nr:hypothetical protein TsFJ059_007306 [Trichoderma semiorbis]